MNKRKYIVPVCESIIMDTTCLMATSSNVVNVSDETTDADAYMSNIGRSSSTSIWDQEW